MTKQYQGSALKNQQCSQRELIGNGGFLFLADAVYVPSAFDGCAVSRFHGLRPFLCLTSLRAMPFTFKGSKVQCLMVSPFKCLCIICVLYKIHFYSKSVLYKKHFWYIFVFYKKHLSLCGHNF